MAKNEEHGTHIKNTMACFVLKAQASHNVTLLRRTFLRIMVFWIYAEIPLIVIKKKTYKSQMCQHFIIRMPGSACS